MFEPVEPENQDATVGIGLVEKNVRQWFQIYDVNEKLRQRRSRSKSVGSYPSSLYSGQTDFTA